MSNYINKENFLDAQVNQYGRNMVMTNVVRETKRKYINIDTQFRDDYMHNSDANFMITLPERIANVKSIMACNAELPLSFYNISENLRNNCFTITYEGTTHIILLPDKPYSGSIISTAINAQVQAVVPLLTFVISTEFSTFTYSGTEPVKINFDVDKTGVFDKYNFKLKLGWLLGFRNQEYIITSAKPVKSECFINLNGPRYLLLIVDEYSQKNPNSFISPQYGFLLNKNILARIIIDSTNYPFGSILPANNFNGHLLTDRRVYDGPIDIKRLNIQLVNEAGIPVNLNGIDFSFCLEVEYE